MMIRLGVVIMIFCCLSGCARNRVGGIDQEEQAEALRERTISEKEARRERKIAEKEVRRVRKAAERGDVRAQNTLGEMYEKGQRVSQNGEEAVRWYRRSADQGYPVAQFNLGQIHERGQVVARDAAVARYWYERAAVTYAPGPERDAAVQASERMAQQLAQAPASPSVPTRTRESPRTPTAAAPRPSPPPSPGQAPPPTSAAPTPRPSPPPSPAPAAAASRRALVIGNAAYPDYPLRNAVNDATDLATLLRQLGFTVTLLIDADKVTMERAIEAFTSGVPPGSVGLFFFSGHGVQIDGVNYLIPSSERFKEQSDVKYRAVLANWVLERMDNARMGVKFLILDACRDNPFGRSWTRSFSRGLAQMDTVEGSLIAYATSPGKTAADGDGRNSPYTAQLLRQLPKPRVPVELMFKAVREAVQEETRVRCGKASCQQTPWEATSLTGEFYFVRQ
jgi:Caspase domain/Sel1 repeat